MILLTLVSLFFIVKAAPSRELDVLHVSKTETGPLHPLCPERDGLFPYPGDCALFVTCANGRGCAMSCGPGTLFHPELHICSHAVTNPCKEVKGARSPDLSLCPDTQPKPQFPPSTSGGFDIMPSTETDPGTDNTESVSSIDHETVNSKPGSGCHSGEDITSKPEGAQAPETQEQGGHPADIHESSTVTSPESSGTIQGSSPEETENTATDSVNQESDIVAPVVSSGSEEATSSPTESTSIGTSDSSSNQKPIMFPGQLFPTPIESVPIDAQVDTSNSEKPTPSKVSESNPSSVESSPHVKPEHPSHVEAVIDGESSEENGSQEYDSYEDSESTEHDGTNQISTPGDSSESESSENIPTQNYPMPSYLSQQLQAYKTWGSQQSSSNKFGTNSPKRPLISHPKFIQTPNSLNYLYNLLNAYNTLINQQGSSDKTGSSLPKSPLDYYPQLTQQPNSIYHQYGLLQPYKTLTNQQGSSDKTGNSAPKSPLPSNTQLPQQPNSFNDQYSLFAQYLYPNSYKQNQLTPYTFNQPSYQSGYSYYTPSLFYYPQQSQGSYGYRSPESSYLYGCSYEYCEGCVPCSTYSSDLSTWRGYRNAYGLQQPQYYDRYSYWKKR